MMFAGMVVFAALLVLNAVVSRRFVPTFILLGYLAAWMMWVTGNERRVLFFYHMLGALLFMALALAYALSSLRRTHIAIGERRIPLSSLAFLQFIGPTTGFIIGVAQGEAFTPLRAASFAFIWGGAAVFAYGAWRRTRTIARA